MNSLCSLHEVSWSSPEGDTVFENINLTVSRGQCVELLGPSGAGKSVLLGFLSLLIRPQSGDVFVGSCAATRWNLAKRARYRNDEVGYIFQRDHFLDFATVMDNVMIPNPLASKSAAENMLNSLGLGKKLNHKVHGLSGGEARRLSVARALVCPKALVLADEPTSQLDDSSAEVVLRILSERVRQGAALVMAHHLPSVSHPKSTHRWTIKEHGVTVESL